MVRDLLLSRGAFLLLIAAFALVAGCAAPPPSNQSPLADAGGEQTASGGEEVILDGSGSSDPEGDSLVYRWLQVAGPTVTLDDTLTAQASFRAPNEDTTLRFTLSVSDEAGASSTDTVNVVVSAADNVPPVAFAGIDQIVVGGAVVALDGSGSLDDDGDLLTYDWAQIGGVSVTLEDIDTASPSFTAANEDDELVFELTVDDGDGHTDTDTVTITVGREPQVLLVTNVSGDSILAFLDPATEQDSVEPDASLSGEEALLDAPIDVLMTSDSWMMVLNRNSNSLNRYVESATSADDQAPYFVVQGPATLLDQPASMAYDSAAAVLFVANTGASNDILAFPGPSEVVFDGDLAPLRVISSAAISLPAGITLDGDGHLYVANTGSNNVLVFNDAGGIGGDVLPDRTISSDSFTDPLDVLVDDDDTLYVVDSSGVVLMFSNASTRDGDSTPSSTLSVPDAQRLVGIEVDAAGVGFLADSEANAIYMYDDISALTGEHTPDRTISGDESGLNRPYGMCFMDE